MSRQGPMLRARAALSALKIPCTDGLAGFYDFGGEGVARPFRSGRWRPPCLLTISLSFGGRDEESFAVGTCRGFSAACILNIYLAFWLRLSSGFEELSG